MAVLPSYIPLSFFKYLGKTCRYCAYLLNDCGMDPLDSQSHVVTSCISPSRLQFRIPLQCALENLV